MGKLAVQAEMRARHNKEWEKKPALLPTGTLLISKVSTRSISKGRAYRVRGHFCTLVTTMDLSTWNQFVTIRADNGWTVKMSLSKFEREEKG
jgi:hypothetical protein